MVGTTCSIRRPFNRPLCREWKVTLYRMLQTLYKFVPICAKIVTLLEGEELSRQSSHLGGLKEPYGSSFVIITCGCCRLRLLKPPPSCPKKVSAVEPKIGNGGQ